MKAFIIPFPEQFNYYYFCPRGHEIVLRGLRENNVELVGHADEADFIFLTYVPHADGIKWKTTDIDKYDSTKLVVIDWIDEFDVMLYPKYHRYFKRSMCNKEKNRMETYPSEVHGIAYCAMKEFFRPKVEKDLDFGCYLRASCLNRGIILNESEPLARNFNSIIKTGYIGPVNSSSRSVGGELYFDEEYLDFLARTKINLHCNPTGWDGDSRLWESLANGCCTISDHIFSDYPNRLVNTQHFLEYKSSSDLYHIFMYLEKNPNKIEEISRMGKDWTVQYNVEASRMKYVLETL